jgi:hypothetical protein
VDYKAFLGDKATVVLPYFGGTRVDSAERRLHVDAGDQQLAPGWWRWKIEGRRAVAKKPESPIELSKLPAVRGHYCLGWVVVDGKKLEHIALPPDDEPAPLSRVTARRWYSNDLIFDSTEFEDDAELAARTALEERRPLGDVKGVVPSLRAAFGYALGMAVARELGIEATPRELTAHVVRIADGGREVVQAIFTDLLEQRRREAEEARRRAEEAVRRLEEAARAVALDEAAKRARVITRGKGRRHDPEARADDVLEKAGARMLSARLVARGQQLDVVYEVDGTRIMSLVATDTFQVLDPGICLSGAHRVLTLDAMPSVVREAIEEEHLNITRRA